MTSRDDSPVEALRSHLASMANLIEKLDDRPEGECLGELPYKVIHLKNNPMEIEIRRREQDHEDLKKENERLRARLELLESGNGADVTRRIDDAVNNNHQIETLKSKVEELKKREAKILDSFRRTSREFKEVCYLLTGYKINFHKDRTYVLSNMYAEREDDKLFFEISPDGTIQLLQNEYSDKLSDLISTYLEHADSFPAFLASLTLDLFKSTTQSTTLSTDMSISMSTTIQPNPLYKRSQF